MSFHEVKEPKKKKRRQLVLTPKNVVAPIYSDASTIVMDNSIPLQAPASEGTQDSLLENTYTDYELPGEILYDEDSLTSLSGEEDGYEEDGPMRDDRPICRGRWEKPEVEALFTACNVNREAIKFHFDGAGGGKDVKRTGWKDVCLYVNDVADTHRTVKQCRTKAAAFSQRVKGKYNRLRFQVSQTGRGKISKKLHISEVEGKALDYLREEAVKGIPGIEALDIGGAKRKPSSRNLALLWKQEREGKPEYDKVNMPRTGVPNNYRDKNKRRIARLDKEKRKTENAAKMKQERKSEKKKEKREKKQMKAEEKKKKEERRDERRKRKEKEERKKRKAERKEKETANTDSKKDRKRNKQVRLEKRKERLESKQAKKKWKADKKDIKNIK